MHCGIKKKVKKMHCGIHFALFAIPQCIKSDILLFAINLITVPWAPDRVDMMHAVFPLRFWSWGQFYKISQTGGSCCTKMIALQGWKLAQSTRKSITFTHFHKICGTNFLKCWANFATCSFTENTGCMLQDPIINMFLLNLLSSFTEL